MGNNSDPIRVSKEIFREVRDMLKENKMSKKKRLNEVFDHNDYSYLYDGSEEPINEEDKDLYNGERWIVWGWPKSGYSRIPILCYADSFDTALEVVGNVLAEEGDTRFFDTPEEVDRWFSEAVEDGEYEEDEKDDFINSLDAITVENEKYGYIYYTSETRWERVKSEKQVKENRQNRRLAKQISESVVKELRKLL